MPATEMTLMDEPDRLRLALTPIRRRLLGRLREPASAAGLAADLGLPRQRVGYHLRVLEEAGLIELVEERPRRGFVERVMRVTAKAFLVDPGVLAPPEEGAGAAGTAKAGARGDTTGTADAGGAGSADSADSADSVGGAGGEGGAVGAARIEAEIAAEIAAGTDEEFRRVADRYAAEHLVEAAADTVRDVTRMADAADRQGVRLLTFTLEARVRFAEPGDVHDFADALADALTRVAERFDTPGGRPYRLVAGGHPAPARGKRATDRPPGAAAPASPNTEDPNDR